MSFIYLKIAAALILLSPIPSFAQTAATIDDAPIATAWERQDFNLVAKRGFGKLNGTVTKGEFLSVAGASGPGDIVFNCMTGREMIAISIDDTPAAEALGNSWDGVKIRPTSVIVKVNGKVEKFGKWRYQGKTKIIFPRNAGAARRFYNYIVRKDKVEIENKGQWYRLEFPKINRDFNEWGAECGIGRLATPKN